VVTREECASLVAVAAIQAAVFIRTGRFIVSILADHLPSLL
jgi:hypothetical protein